LDRLIPYSLGDLFLVKGVGGEALTWAKIIEAGGRGVDLKHGFVDTDLSQKLENLVSEMHSRKRIFAATWEDDSGGIHVDDRRVDAKLRGIVGLPLSKHPPAKGRERGKEI